MDAELKIESVNSEENAQASKSLEEELSLEKIQEESVDSLRAKLKKAEEERENYKTGMLKYKKQVKEVDSEEDVPNVSEVAEKAALSVIERNNERIAINRFTEKYPALRDPAKWREVIVNYSPRNGKESSESISKDLEAALMLAKHYGGGKVGGEEISLSAMGTVSSTGSTVRRGSSDEMSEKTAEMGRRFNSSPEYAEKLKKEDDTFHAEIRI